MPSEVWPATGTETVDNPQVLVDPGARAGRSGIRPPAQACQSPLPTRRDGDIRQRSRQFTRAGRLFRLEEDLDGLAPKRFVDYAIAANNVNTP